MADKPTIAFVETSLTDGSFEADLAKEIMNIVGDRAEAITIGYEDLPLAGEAPEYPLPEAALAVRDKLGNADAVWVVVSEYKKEIPDSLRNLFDWLSLPSTKDEEGKNVLDQKPVAISGVGGFEELHPRIMVGDLLEDAGMRLFPVEVGLSVPDEAVQRALADYKPGSGRTLLVATGKAAWQMAKAAVDTLGKVDGGVVVTKYDHVMGEIPGVTCYEAGHPVPDENSFNATAAALDLVKGLTADDTVLFLLSGGGSALFEQPLVSGEELQDITKQLLACGADIVEMNTIRKRLSGVKGGKFALACAPAKVRSIVLSDIIGDPLDMIASGPAYPDGSTCKQAQDIVAKYGIKLSDKAKELLTQETPKSLDNVTTMITGSVRELCAAAAVKCSELGYEPILLTDQLTCEAREAGSFMASILRTHAGDGKKLAYIAGGETVVHLTGKGLGGRNQELALAAAPGINGIAGAAVFSVGSDGTDGPTDAAGGYVDCESMGEFEAKGIDVFAVLKENDAYHALGEVGGLVMTGPTGTNVNDVAVALIG